MRENIGLYRGKRIDNGEWVEGFYYKAKYYRTDKELCDFITVPHLNEEGRGNEHFIVISETVGQYTGLTDKNGKKIFEGDIVNEYDMPEEISNTGIVKWSNLFMGWYINKTRSMYCHEYMSYEVIGNIYDNPELLKGGAK